MTTGPIEIAARVLDAFCACVEPRTEDAIALRDMAESAKEERMRLGELACAVIVRERCRLRANAGTAG